MNFKEAVVVYGLQSPFVKEMLSNWATQHRVSQEWSGLMLAAQEGRQYLLR